MRFYLSFILLLLISLSFAQTSENIKKAREKQLKVQNQKENLDFKRMDEELKAKDQNSTPFTYGIFPYPVYDSIQKDGFKGVGTLGNFFGLKLQGKRIVYSSFSEKNWGALNAHKVKNKDRIFFTILVLTDFIDDKEYTSSKMQIVSRNFPDVIGQGFVKTSNNRIDFSAFTTLEKEEFAIVNLKLYNLKYGHIILIAPQKDGSLRSLQINNTTDLTSETLKSYMEQLIQQPEVFSFFINEKTI
ncbi:hypothetical protein [Chryseobacterium sp. JV558]|uniref:hypothetical protein n=1 Tax=Chryseobacterium sp. JV558 TaxID=2663236 RepID=UPI00299D9E65|nr:hypothetical protein [Chryseobacterium sp. JV558]MDW9381820.1 hypothetical protein [Chryseobacterium sp. JV558]